MSKFRISPHMRLHEWVADAEGFFTAEGLDYEFIPTIHLAGAPSVSSSETLPPEWRRGAFETFVQGRPCDISSACHWATNVASARGDGRMWGHAYSVCPSAIFVPPESPLRRPEDLAGVEVTVGYHSGSHFSTLQALEATLPPDQIKLRFTGSSLERLAALLERKVPAGTSFGLAYYLLEQQGFRKVLDNSFMMGFQVTSEASQEDLEKYFRAMGRAQQAIDLEPERFKHYYLRELPERYHASFDPRLAGTGERIVFQPYTREIFERTHRWVIERGLFDATEAGTADYGAAIVI
jgi:NitT/TauT family transport system substrate-binding protein